MRSGYVEAVYGKCLAIEFKKERIIFRPEVESAIYYEGIIVGKRRVDFVVEEKVMVEIKALTELTDQHLAQALNYLETHNFEVGLLMNFGAKSLQFKRLVHQIRHQQMKDPINPKNP